MKLLLDTHTFLWFLADDPRLGGAARQLIEDGSNERWLSTASIWEMAIKLSIGKMTLAEPLESFIPREISTNQVQLLPIDTVTSFR